MDLPECYRQIINPRLVFSGKKHSRPTPVAELWRSIIANIT